MAIDDVKQSIIENVTNAYNTVDAKGGAITGAKNLENLSESIDSIVTGTVIGYHVRSVINDDGETQTLKISAGKLPEGELNITENGRYDVADYAEAVVDVPSEEPVLIDKTITENGEYSASADGADGYSNVSVDIPDPVLVSKEFTENGSYSASDDNADGYKDVTINVAGLIPSGTLSVSANGIYDVTNYASADVNIAVEGGGGLGAALNYGVSEIIDTNGEVTHLREYAIYQNSTITTINLPACTSMGGSAIYNNAKVKTVSLPLVKSIPIYGMRYNDSMTSVYAPKCETIGQWAFDGCKALPAIDFPMCKSIASSAFAGCINVSSINLPMCEYIDAAGLAVGNKLSVVNLPEAKYFGYNVFGGAGSTIQSCSFPKLSRCQVLFSSNSYIQSIYLPELLSCGGSPLASNCSNLISIDLPKCTTFGGARACANLVSLSLPVCTMVYGDNGSCPALTKLDLPECSWFSYGVFSYCSALSEINAPKTTHVLNYAFMKCSALKSINFPSCQILSAGCFSNCSALSRVVLGSDMSYFYSSVFARCTNLSVVVLNKSTPVSFYATNFANVFAYTPIVNSSYLGYFGSIYVPADAVETYKTAYNWSAYSDRITSIDNLPAE